MATLVKQVIVLSGLEPAYEACDGDGDEFVNSGRAFIHVKNGHSGPQTVIVNSQAACNQGVDHDISVEITNAEDRMIGPFPKARFNTVAGKVQITYSGVTLLTIAVIEVP